MIKNYFYLLLFIILLGSGSCFPQSSSFDPVLWLYNPKSTKYTAGSSDYLNFKNKVTVSLRSAGTSSRKLRSGGHLFVVYKSQKDENLLTLVGKKQALFLDGNRVMMSDSVDTHGYNESYGELLDIRFGGMEEGRFWMNSQIEASAVFEVVLTDQQLSDRSVNEIRTYLGIKYGIDLIDYKQYSYNGTKMWNGSDKTYNNHIFGAARMDYFNLEPDKSIHVKDSDLIVSVSKNQKRYFDEGTYILFGNNRRPLTFDQNTNQSRKQWLVQTNKEKILVDAAFPLSRLHPSGDTFNEYELVVSDQNSSGNARSYTGRIKDTLLVFKNVSFSSSANSVIRLKEHRSDFKLDIDRDCEKIRLKIESPPGMDEYRITAADDQGKNVLSETSNRKSYTIANNASYYYDVVLEYNHKKVSQRVTTLPGVLRASDLKEHYLLEEGAAEIRLENPEDYIYEWFKNDRLIGRGNHIVIYEEGAYGLTVSNSSGCSITQNFTAGASFGHDRWNIFPNPAGSTENLQASFNLEEKSSVKLALYESGGRLVKTFSLGMLENETVDLGALGLPSGMYMVIAYINEIPQIRKIIIK